MTTRLKFTSPIPKQAGGVIFDSAQNGASPLARLALSKEQVSDVTRGRALPRGDRTLVNAKNPVKPEFKSAHHQTQGSKALSPGKPCLGLRSEAMAGWLGNASILPITCPDSRGQKRLEELVRPIEIARSYGKTRLQNVPTPMVRPGL